MNLTLRRQFLGQASGLLSWMEDPEVTDILVNGCSSLFVERAGKLEPVVSPFADTEALLGFIERILVPLGRRVDAARPYMDGRLSDGSRFHLILPPLAPAGPILSIRKSRTGTAAPYSSFGDSALLAFLAEDFLAGRNWILAGGTGAGKTTLLSRLLEKVPGEERLVVVEESAEIQVAHPHCVFLEARAATPDGLGEVTLRTLIRNALRMRPDRLVLGEVRGDEAWVLIQALNTGHAGSLCTVHANSALDALRRLETLILAAGVVAPLSAVREWVAGAVHGVAYLAREGKQRRVVEVLRIQGLEGEKYRVWPYRGPGQNHVGTQGTL